jgi:hypothetical protein
MSLNSYIMLDGHARIEQSRFSAAKLMSFPNKYRFRREGNKNKPKLAGG